jgi:hypothetical protein
MTSIQNVILESSIENNIKSYFEINTNVNAWKEWPNIKMSLVDNIEDTEDEIVTPDLLIRVQFLIVKDRAEVIYSYELV